MSALLVITAIPSQAQRSTRVMIAGSAVVPAGDFSKTVSNAPGFLAGVILGPNDSPVGVRLDVSHYRFDGKTTNNVGNPNVSTTAITANAIATLTTGYTKPYLIAGFGWYSNRFSDSTTSRSHAWGLNGGAGIAFPFILGGAFLEVRYHEVNTKGLGQRYIPISFGLIF